LKIFFQQDSASAYHANQTIELLHRETPMFIPLDFVGMCGKPKFGLDSVFFKLNRANIDIHADGFLNCTQSAIQIKSE